MLLRSDGQRGELLVVVLHLKGSAVGHKSAVRQADTQRGADLGALHGEGIVVLTVDVTGDDEVVLKNFESLPRDHVDCENTISHENYSKVVLTTVLRFPLLDLATAFGFDPFRRTHARYGARVGRFVAATARPFGRYRLDGRRSVG